MKQNKSIKSYVGQLVRMVHESEKNRKTQKRKGGTTTGIQNVKKHDLPQQKSTNLFLIAEPEWISRKFSVKKNPIDRDSWDSLFTKTIGHATTYWKICASMFFLRGKAKLIVMTMFKLCRMYIYIFNQSEEINLRPIPS